MAFYWLISGYLSVDCTLRAFDIIILGACLVIVFICDIDMLIMMIDHLYWGFWLLRFFLCFIAMSIWDIGMLIVLIDHLALLSIVTLILPWLFSSPHMYRLTVVYHLTWWVDSLACILSWSTLSMLSLSLFALIVIIYMWTWVIYLYFAWLYVAWLPSSVWLHAISPCGPHIYPFTSNPLVSVISFILALTFVNVRLCVCLFLWLS